MRIFVTGGTGFVGTRIADRLKELGQEVRCLTRSGQSLDGVEVAKGDILDPSTLDGSMEHCDAVIHLVGIIEERPSRGVTFDRIYVDGTRNVVDAARKAGVRTFVYMSANGAREDGVSSYQKGKWKAEEMVRGAGFESATIFRPSLIFGAPIEGRREFASDLVDQLIKPFPVLPIFGDGSFSMQPVAVDSVARAFADAATRPVAGVREYCVAGPEPIPYVELVDIITRASGRSTKPKVHIPVAFVRLGIELMGWTGLLPVSRDQLEMLVEGNTCDSDRFHADFGISPVPFDIETLSYLRETGR